MPVAPASRASGVRLSSANPEAAQLQLIESAARIATETGRRPTTFAHPFGGLDPFAQALVPATGYARRSPP